MIKHIFWQLNLKDDNRCLRLRCLMVGYSSGSKRVSCGHYLAKKVYLTKKTHIFQFTICTFRHSEVHLALFILFVLWEYKGEQDSGEPVGCDEQKWCQGEKSVSPFPKSTIKSILIVNVLRIYLNRKNHLVSVVPTSTPEKWGTTRIINQYLYCDW